MRLPGLPAAPGKNLTEPLGLQGINYGDNFRDGDLEESQNLSTRRFPAIATRNAREQLTEYSGVTALGAWEALVAVSGTDLLYDGDIVGSVTAGEKQMSVVNTKLVIWPDKVYLDLDSMSVKPLADSLSGSGGVFTTNTLTVSGWGDLTQHFSVGDTVEISGSSQTGNNKYVTIKELTATVLTAANDSFTAVSDSGTLSIARNIPDLDYICESNNRLWGCDTETRSIYASALGDPSNFYTYEGLSTDSYAVAVGGEGDFTGCCRLGSSVLFWRERKLYKIMGGFPAEYSMVSYDIEGVKAGCHKSLRIINDMLYYLGPHGVYRYNGGTPQLVSEVFGQKKFSDGSAGTEGEKYYLSVMDGNTARLLVFDTKYNLWLREDDTNVIDFAQMGGRLYFCDDEGGVWLADSGAEDPDILWGCRFTPLYESISGRKKYKKLLLRVLIPKGGWMETDVKFDGRPWTTLGKLTGKTEDVKTLVIPINRVDRLQIRIRGKGPCAILGVSREYLMGSDR